MIVISGTISIDPANTDAAVELMAELETATRAEPGNIQYAFWLSHSEPGTFLVFEEWADDDALNAHMSSPHMAEFLGGAAGLGITGTSIDRYDVSTKTKFM
ncbi:MAG: putative quinol monooxygenase [Acidimicrobiales bacterium]